MENLDELFKCVLSQKPINEPYFLICGHVFEKKDILDWSCAACEGQKLTDINVVQNFLS